MTPGTVERLSRASPRLARAALSRGAALPAARLAEADAALGPELAAVEADLAALARGARVAAAAARHLVAAGGKRVRPALLLLAHRAAGGRPGDPRARRLAAVAEAVHGATLLHDDVVDLGEARRGAPAARLVYGNAASVLGGDLLLVRALAVAADVRPALVPSLLSVLARMVDAEALQLERRGRAALALEEYRAVVDGKTASLFEWAAWAGGALARRPERAGALGRFGREVGAAFQVTDDLLDLFGAEAALGKGALADVREGKVTLPLVFALRADPGLAAALEAAARGEEGNAPRGRSRTGVEATTPSRSGAARPSTEPPSDVLEVLGARVREAARRGGGVEAARAEVASGTARAVEALAALPPSPERESLAEIARALAERAS
jgi:octaprenyl-diphosphate synthase